MQDREVHREDGQQGKITSRLESHEHKLELYKQELGRFLLWSPEASVLAASVFRNENVLQKPDTHTWL